MFVSSAQDMEPFFISMKHHNYESALQILNKENDSLISQELNTYYRIMRYGDLSDSIPTIGELDPPLLINLKLLNQGVLYYLQKGNEPKATRILKASARLAEERNDTILICESLRFILEIYQRLSSIVYDPTYKYHLEDYKKHLYDQFERDNYLLKSIILLDRSAYDNTDEVMQLFSRNKNKLDHIVDTFLKNQYYITWGHFECTYKKNLDLSDKILNRTIIDLESLTSGLFVKERVISAKINLARTYILKEQYQKALTILTNLEIDNSQYLFKLIESFQLFWLSQAHKKLGNKEIGNNLYIKYLEQTLKNDQSYNTHLVAEQQIKYRTEEKEKALLLEQQKSKQQRTIAIVLAGLVLLVATIGFLLQKNAKRKQLLAEQDRALESQKLSTVLKEQELRSIDAMIAGQEKERQRIANDLHDDLGSLMATVKLHISALKTEASPQLFDKALLLIDQTYQKIRSISHERGSGVLANKTLLKAIKDMANSTSISKNLDIEVVDYGLDQSIDNSLELTIFRIIQELITNILKHANATEATIHITHHDQHLNVMVEDNGQGFNPKTLSQNSGMGIHSIDRRVDSLGGTITIESEANKGTTVIIDIPLL